MTDKKNRAWIEIRGIDKGHVFLCYRNPDGTVTKVKTTQLKAKPATQ